MTLPKRAPRFHPRARPTPDAQKAASQAAFVVRVPRASRKWNDDDLSTKRK